MYTLHSFAKLVGALRACQKANGTGYRTLAGKAAASALENEVDAAVTEIAKQWFPLEKPPEKN